MHLCVYVYMHMLHVYICCMGVQFCKLLKALVCIIFVCVIYLKHIQIIIRHIVLIICIPYKPLLQHKHHVYCIVSHIICMHALECVIFRQHTCHPNIYFMCLVSTHVNHQLFLHMLTFLCSSNNHELYDLSKHTLYDTH